MSDAEFNRLTSPEGIAARKAELIERSRECAHHAANEAKSDKERELWRTQIAFNDKEIAILDEWATGGPAT